MLMRNYARTNRIARENPNTVLIRNSFFTRGIIIFFRGAVALGIIKFIWTTTTHRNLFDCIVYAGVEYKTFGGSVFYANEHTFLFCFIFTPGSLSHFSDNTELLF